MPALRPLRWKKEQAVPWLVSAALLAAALLGDIVGAAQRWAYDNALEAAAKSASPDVVVVAIDAASLARHGAWPWSRELHSQVVNRLRAAGAQVVVHTEPFIGAESQRALAELNRIATTVAGDPALAHHPELPNVLSFSRDVLDADGQLAQSLAAQGRSLLALGSIPGDTGELARALVEGAPPAAGQPSPGDPGPGSTPPWPLPILAKAALAVGHLDLTPDADGRLRRHALQRSVDGQVVASLAWLGASVQRGLAIANPPPAGRSVVPLGAARVPLSPDGMVAPIYSAQRSNQPTFVQISADAILNGHFNARSITGKLVLIGRTGQEARAAGVVTPGGEQISRVEALAHLSSALLTGQLVAQPAWARGLPWLALLGALAYLGALAPRLAAASGLALSALLALCLLLGAQLGLSAAHVWSPMVLPAAVLLLGHLTLIAARRQRPEAARPQRDTGALATPSVSPVLAAPGPALTPAASTSTPALPGTQESVLSASAHGDQGSGFGAGPERSLAATQPLHPADTSPATQPAAMYRPTVSTQHRLARLGVYLLEHEIGRGTMGRVYLASEIGHGGEVAVKTLALAREFEGFALREARARFQREALAASRLQHPDIVRILQSGEERGLAFIAMERLHGHDLSQHIHPGTLLPMGSVVAIGARVAAALAHAHAQGVIHRDIKPANVMIDLAHGQVKVTDFGIARITDAARTRTGLVLGSPSYMSPEQLTGRAADGRSDLYSLGVLLFQLLTGRLPQQGHTLAEMTHAATQVPAPDVRQFNPEVPESLADVINILLQKRPELRYRDGTEVAADLRLVGSLLARQSAAGMRSPPPTATSVQECATPVGAARGSAAGPGPNTAQSSP